MDKTYILTGAGGHLGKNILSILLQRGACVRCLYLPGEAVSQAARDGAAVYVGDVLKPQTLAPLLEGLEGRKAVVIHAAGLVDIASKATDAAWKVNVLGTQNMLDLCLRGPVWRFLYVSSVHAIPEPEHGRTITEPAVFDKELVRGAYAKSKAEASRRVLAAVALGLPGLVVCPSGIMGPLDDGGNHIVAAVKAYLAGRLPFCVKGGYNIVDVRDVALACLDALDRGRVGESYILAGQHYEISEIFQILRELGYTKRPCPKLPLPLVKLAAPVAERWARRHGTKMLFTPYSLEALGSNDHFSTQKAQCELGFHPRDMRDTLNDTAAYLLGRTAGM